ncbi:DUF4474 domain-containing protein [Desulfosporosinus sp. Sb-LF]|uniref:DUF4474 domain-containing protein n=1 Tax=Desulfosporosinus sp. Sb-LF TaxID=2560027 RepID=UPI00107F115E|nr:DUF4474 domain-containing protein [Desulfosporosinus sp. Sb-LF]TGE32034.1 DUF4474 domain-containing protein [Desulfosporosinus sp. Sb-LF]
MSIQKRSIGETVTRRNGDDLSFLPQGTGNEELDKAIEMAGYSYDLKQDIFYSTMNPWQRSIGYCRLYDEAAAPLGMIIDCEPIYFEYNKRKWMIGLWKGQYDLVTGGEIGIYTGALDLKIPDIFSGTFYNCCGDADLLQMSFTLRKNGKTLFTREGKHWWLTGFKLGEFSEPSELAMDIKITFNDEIMRDSFVTGLRSAGYLNNEFTIDSNSVSFAFDIPHTQQPITRTTVSDRIIQKNNEQLCKMYQDITGQYATIPDKVKAIEEQAPEIYEKIMHLGRSKQSYEKYAIIMVLLIVIGIILTSCLIGDDKQSL